MYSENDDSYLHSDDYFEYVSMKFKNSGYVDKCV